MIEELLNKVAADDPAKGRWNVAGSDVTVWTDASSLALGVAIELDGEVLVLVLVFSLSIHKRRGFSCTVSSNR